MVASVHITSTGARTPLGIQAASGMAAYRAGMSAVGEHPFMIDHLGNPMPSAIDHFLDPGLMGADRLLALAESALQETCVPLNNLPVSYLEMPLYLGLPEIRPGFTEQDAEIIGKGISQFKDLPIKITKVSFFTAGHSAGLIALASAAAQIRQGNLDACIVGGVDSYFQPDTMEWLDENLQLATADSRSAFVPGEGAGFCLLMSSRIYKQWRLNSLARILSTAVGKETKLIKTTDVCLGEGLAYTIKSALSNPSVPPAKVDDIICDINGERYRGEEWGFACLRLTPFFDDPTSYHSPADSWGDTGAASGLLFTALACQAAIRGYAKGPRTVLWTSSEGGQRAATVLELEIKNGTVKRGINYV